MNKVILALTGAGDGTNSGPSWLMVALILVILVAGILLLNRLK